MPINFIEQYNDSLELDTLKGMTEELIEMYGYPCIHHQFVGPDMVNHPLYKDRLTSTDNIDEFVTEHETKVFLENKHFVPQLLAQGYALNTETTINAFMKLEDNVQVEDIVTLLYKHEARKYKFQVNSATNWKNLCYNIVLSVYVQDNVQGIINKSSPDIPYPVKSKPVQNKRRMP